MKNQGRTLKFYLSSVFVNLLLGIFSNMQPNFSLCLCIKVVDFFELLNLATKIAQFRVRSYELYTLQVQHYCCTLCVALFVVFVWCSFIALSRSLRYECTGLISHRFQLRYFCFSKGKSFSFILKYLKNVVNLLFCFGFQMGQLCNFESVDFEPSLWFPVLVIKATLTIQDPKIIPNLNVCSVPHMPQNTFSHQRFQTPTVTPWVAPNRA